MTVSIRPVKGTRDFYPQDMAVRNWLYKNIARVSEAYGYQEYEGPLLEYIELYAAKSGEELVKEQSFVFEDRGGDRVTLRPELTPTLARMVAQRQNQLVYPLRWWSWGPFWRYERPQKGRSREFFQWNIDLIGIDSPAADAEMLSIIATFLSNTGLMPSDVKILVNNRELIDGELDSLGIGAEVRSEAFHLIDRKDKLSPSAWETYADDIGLTTAQTDGLKSILANENLWQKSKRMESLLEIVDALGAAPYIKFSPQIIRGLDYYTGTVFEVWDKEKNFRAILGGGRYDNLVSDVGGNPLPAIGFAMGDMVVKLVLEKFGCIPEEVGHTSAQVLVTIFDEATLNESYTLASELRAVGLNVSCYPASIKLGKQFKYGDRIGIPIAVILGPDELANNQVAIKDLRSGSQIITARTEAPKKIQQLLDNQNPS